MNKKFGNISLRKETIAKLDLLAKRMQLSKDDLIRKGMTALEQRETSNGLKELDEQIRKSLNGFKAAESVDIDDIDISEAYL